MWVLPAGGRFHRCTSLETLVEPQMYWNVSLFYELPALRHLDYNVHRFPRRLRKLMTSRRAYLVLINRLLRVTTVNLPASYYMWVFCNGKQIYLRTVRFMRIQFGYIGLKARAFVFCEIGTLFLLIALL